MKKINLRLCVAGPNQRLEQFKKCLESYKKHFEINKLIIYTTDNLRDSVKQYVPSATIISINQFTQATSRFSKTIQEVLDFSRNLYCGGDPMRNFFYEHIRWLMDYYYINDEPVILSDTDILIGDKIKIIEDWIDSPNYLLYASNNCDGYFYDNAEILKKEDISIKIFDKIPYFNCGFMCIPANFKMDMEQIFKMISYNPESWVSEQTAIAIFIIRNGRKTKIIPIKKLAKFEGELKDKTLLHGGPFGVVI